MLSAFPASGTSAALAAALIMQFAAASPAATTEGDPVVTDVASLQQLLSMRRHAILEAMSVEYSVHSWEASSGGAGWDVLWRVAWDTEDFTIRTVVSDDPAPGTNGSRRSWSAAEGKTLLVSYGFIPGDGTAQISDSPEECSGILPGYCFLIGVWPMRTLAGKEPLLNDVQELLKRDDVTIRPDTEEVDGLECVIVEWYNLYPPGMERVIIRVALAPALRYAIVRAEVFGDRNSRAVYEASDFHFFDPDSAAIPLTGRFRDFDAEGAVEAERTYRVLFDGDAPRLFLGQGPTAEDMTIPAGFTVTDLGTGKTWIAAADTHLSKHRANHTYRAAMGLALGGGFLLAGLAGAAQVIRRRRSRQTP